MADINVDEYLERDWYEIYECYGEKWIHILGYAYYTDESEPKPYRAVEYCGFDLPLNKFIDNWNNDTDWYGQAECETKQYIGDYTEDSLEDYLLSGTNPISNLKILSYDNLTMETECGEYINS